MANSKWYYLCNLQDKVALEYTLIPAVWGNITGLSDASDETLADLAWSNNPNRGFLTPQAVSSAGITISASVTALATEVAKELIRKKRSTLLAKTDADVTIDRWNSYTDEKKTTIATYRQALRDMTSTPDVFYPVYPAIPAGLEYLISVI